MTADVNGATPVIGLEIHLQLRTRTKLFCACRAEYGGDPNSRVCPVCLGLPGALPTLNEQALELATRTALALGFAVAPESRFARKHYFYPDLPKGYQITQHLRPLATAGFFEVPLKRLHLEEDSGRTTLAADGDAALLDFNRAGVPLVEIVTEPAFDSPARARAFLVRIKRVLEHLEVSDCNMEEGSLRVDANLSLRSGAVRSARTEVKNLNSFSAVERALEHEIGRHREMLAGGRVGELETRGWDAAAGLTRSLRGKEELADYRYLDEPDLPPLRVPSAQVEAIRAGLPELPAARAERLAASFGLDARLAEALTAFAWLAAHFEAIVSLGAPPRLAATWLLGESLAGVEGALAPRAMPGPAATAELLTLLDGGEITREQARATYARMRETGAGAAETVAALGFEREAGPERIDAWVERVLRDNAAEVERFRAGERRLLEHLMGRAMALSRGAADPSALRGALERRLGE